MFQANEEISQLLTQVVERKKQYPAFDVEKFLRELPAVLPQNMPAEPEDVCLICLVT